MTGNMVSGAVAARAWDYIPIAREARMSMRTVNKRSRCSHKLDRSESLSVRWQVRCF